MPTRPTREIKSIRSSAAWRRARAAALARDEYCCRALVDGELCGAVSNWRTERNPDRMVSVEVHHIVPLSEGGDPYDLENLVSVCWNCHHHVHAGRMGFQKGDG